VITGGGEPTLIGSEALERLVAAARAQFSKVVLISNGALWGKMAARALEDSLLRLGAAGLSVLALSRHHFDPERNCEIMGLESRSEDLMASLGMLAGRGLRIKPRWICVLQRDGIDDERSVGRYLDMSVTAGVGEVCFKELYVSTSVDSLYHDREANDWSRRNQVPLRLVTDFARNQGWAICERLPWGAPVLRGGGTAVPCASRRTLSPVCRGSSRTVFAGAGT
jgi:hypothetical protein